MPSPVDVVIVTYNSATTIAACLRSLNSPLINQVITIDNSTDNRGFARAANLGAAKATSPYILFLNPDAALTSNALEIATSYLKTHPGVALTGLTLQDETGNPELSSFGPVVTLATVLLRHFNKNSLPTEPTRVGWVSAAALLIRRPVFEQVNGFDSIFFMYWEDVDLCLRTQKAGYSVVLLPPAKAIHQRGASLRDQTKKTALYDASADKYFRKHYATTIWFLHHWLRRLYRFFSPLAL